MRSMFDGDIITLPSTVEQLICTKLSDEDLLLRYDVILPSTVQRLMSILWGYSPFLRYHDLITL